MFVEFFIRRPVLTIVASLIILMIGAISIPTLPVEQYPNISPVQVNVSARYIGANAKVVEDTVTTVLEREINGIEGLRYLSSISSEDGVSNITVTFEQGRDLDDAAVDVLNRVSLAEPRLPDVVRQTGVSVTKESSGTLVGMALFSDDDRYDSSFISNYADLYILDELRRIQGVAGIQPFGERLYAMRLWLDPDRLAARSLTAQDVVTALQEQNLQVGGGRIGQPPAPGLSYQLPIQVVGRLQEVADFEEMVIKADPQGGLVRLRDVGRVELGAENYDTFARYRRQNAVGYRISQLPGSNALESAHAIKTKMAELKANFPPGLDYEIPYDPTLFVEESRKEVVKTLLEAVALVVLVLFLFLQNWQATLVPAVVIPIALIGTFAFIKVFDFSMNSLTLFGLTLATGVVVDDAIVVVESITGKVQDQGMSPRRAAIESMAELTGAVIATSLVLMAVFVPVSFFPGTTGQLYQQFALTIAFSILISTFNALTLTPALSALLLRPSSGMGGLLGGFFGMINGAIDRSRRAYLGILTHLARLRWLVVGIFGALLVWTAWLYLHVPTAFLPEEDQGYLISLVQGPEGSSLEHTGEIVDQSDAIFLEVPEVAGTFSLGGFGFSGNSASGGITFTPLIPWGDRKGPGQSATEILGQVFPKLMAITQGRVIAFNPPTIQGLGNVGGFVFQLRDRGNNGIDALVAARDQIVAEANQRPELLGVFSTYTANAPQLLVELDRDKLQAQQVGVDEVLNTLQIYLGSRYVNDFNAFGRTYRVYVQADGEFRRQLEDIQQLYVRSRPGTMVPLGSLVRVKTVTGPQIINHYNLAPSIEINGTAAPGYSSGQAIAVMEEVAAAVLPRSMDFAWSGISLEELESGGQAPLIFGLGIIFVFLVLAAQYENFIDPLTILMAVPLAVLGAMLAVSWRGFANDVYCQVGLVMLVGLASKNSIIIVEFANQLRAQGVGLVKAAVEAAQQRLRPIIMTAISTLLGIFPLTVATGAGAASRQSVGTAVFGGMIVATVLSLFVVPILYIVMCQLFDRLKSSAYGPLGEDNGRTGQEVFTPLAIPSGDRPHSPD